MEEKNNINSKSNGIKVSITLIVIIFIAMILAIYLINDDFRCFVDTKILKKEISENTSNIIEINSESNPYIYAFDNYITILSKNILTFYNKNANVVSELDIDVTKPYVISNGKYLAIAEDGGNKVYLLTDTGIKWEKDVDGQIYRVSVNENGYVSVLLKNTTYKSIVVVYNLEGTELFRTYLATNYAICSEISPNNKYLVIGQINYSGTIVKSVVKLISIDKVKDNPQDSISYTYESESNKILNNIKFNNKNEAICMFDSYIQKVTELSDEKIYDIKSNSIFVDINLGNNIVAIEKEDTSLFSNKYQINIINTAGKSSNLYFLENDIPKKLKVTKDLICLNLANEVRIISPNAWLIKKYTTNSEIQDIVIGENIIGIIYNNKIEIINI